MENKIEKLLRQTAEDHGYLPLFYQTLLVTDIYVLGENTSSKMKAYSVKPGDEVEFQHWVLEGERVVVPIFSSIHNIQKAVGYKDNFLRINGRLLFEITQGEELTLNPHGPYGKEFTVKEIGMLLSGDLFDQTQEHIWEKESKVVLEHAQNVPEGFQEALVSFLQGQPDVQTAYLARVVGDEGDQHYDHFVIGLDVAGNYAEIVGQLSLVVSQILEGGGLADFVEIGTGALDDFLLNETSPIYQREE